MIFGLVRLIILSYNGQKRHIKRKKIIGRPHIMCTTYSVMQKLSNKQSGCMIFRLVKPGVHWPVAGVYLVS